MYGIKDASFVRIAQKNIEFLVKFVNTDCRGDAIIMIVKTPNTLYIFLLHPIISEVVKRTASPAVLFAV